MPSQPNESHSCIRCLTGREYTVEMQRSRGFGIATPTDRPHTVTYNTKRVFTASSEAEAKNIVTSWRENVRACMMLDTDIL